jgi:hypothetical protein
MGFAQWRYFAGFPAAVAVDSHNLCSKLKSKRLR